MAAGAVVAIGDPARLRGYALAGVTVVPATSPAGARAAWRALGADVAVVVLTRPAAAAIGPVTGPLPMLAVLPEAAGP
ncbi:V-type ATP synthase subunit F [Dactylosporangium sp. CA-092794]|uniref:V-type ATP synthase subunit F n=1 Tax=Dactylosporangium sp. CA-092794 TaxID=3239929 RepID=UPI003D94C6F1